jgi:UDP-N-acetylglucosamine 2-epimerase
VSKALHEAGHTEFLVRTASITILKENARLILTNSGGMQKEAYFYGLLYLGVGQPRWKSSGFDQEVKAK